MNASGGSATRRAASALGADHTSENRRSDPSAAFMGRIASGPPGRKCCVARPSCGISWPSVATMPDWS